MRLILEKARSRRYQTNLTKDEKNGNKKAMMDKNRVFLPADKERIIVAMDKWECEENEERYEYKIKKVLADLKAKPSVTGGINWDLTKKVCREASKIIQNIVRRNELTEETGNYLKPRDCHAPRLSGLPKVHKDGVPLRGIMSTVGSPFEKISKFLIPILRVIDCESRELKEKVKNWRLKRNEVLVSHDVKNFCTRLYRSIKP